MPTRFSGVLAVARGAAGLLVRAYGLLAGTSRQQLVHVIRASVRHQCIEGAMADRRDLGPPAVAIRMDQHDDRSGDRHSVCADLVALCCEWVFHGQPLRLHSSNDGRQVGLVGVTVGAGAASSLVCGIQGSLVAGADGVA